MSSSSDLYAIMGITSKANVEEIKSAYHTKVKKVHPDKNQSDSAQKQFLELTNAYKILADPEKKFIYDLLKIFEDCEFLDEKIPCCQLCKMPKDHLRFIIFKEVIREKLTPNLKRTKGIFCLNCANLIAVKASMRTWLSGIWLFPFGTFLSLIALINNMKGGQKPNKLNSRLLINYAHHLIKRGELARAKSIIRSALDFTKTPKQYNVLKDLLYHLKTVKEKKISWSKFNSAFWIQITPFLILSMFFLIMLYFYNPPNFSGSFYKNHQLYEQESLKVINLPDDPSDQNLIYDVFAEGVNLHQGPGINFGIIELLNKGQKVRITGLVPGTLWVKIKTDHSEGFVISEFLIKTNHQD